MLGLDDPRLNAGYFLPDPVHPSSLVDAVREVAGRSPDMWDSSTRDSLVARVAIELGCRWPELEGMEDLTTELNDFHTPGAPLRFEGLALEYWSLLDDLAAYGWRWDEVAKRIAHEYECSYGTAPF